MSFWPLLLHHLFISFPLLEKLADSGCLWEQTLTLAPQIVLLFSINILLRSTNPPTLNEGDLAAPKGSTLQTKDIQTLDSSSGHNVAGAHPGWPC